MYLIICKLALSNMAYMRKSSISSVAWKLLKDIYPGHFTVYLGKFSWVASRYHKGENAYQKVVSNVNQT